MTLSLEEAERVVDRHEPLVTWGVGCHPRGREAQEGFDVDWFADLAKRAAIVGEIGLDAGARVPLDVQLRTFRSALATVARLPRLTSMHSYRATGLLLEELRKTPIAVPVLHWWTGTADETEEAVALGCYFSVHSAVARHSKFRTRVPPERILVESDHGNRDPPAAIPCRIEWAEHLEAQQLRTEVTAVRRLVWRNFGAIINQTSTWALLPAALQEIVRRVSRETEERRASVGDDHL
jgi:TatD DNase family protein